MSAQTLAIETRLSDEDVRRIVDALAERDAATTYPLEFYRPLNVTQAAEFLGVNRTTLYLLTTAGDVPCVYVGQTRRYVPAVLIPWLLARTEKPAADADDESADGEFCLADDEAMLLLDYAQGLAEDADTARRARAAMEDIGELSPWMLREIAETLRRAA